MAHEPIELMLGPRKVTSEYFGTLDHKAIKKQKTPNSVTRAQMPKDTKEIAKLLIAWIDQEPRMNIKHFTRIYGARLGKLKELAETCPELKEAYEYAREQISSNIQDAWFENSDKGNYADRWIEYYDSYYHAHRNSIRSAVTKGLAQAGSTLHITHDSMGMLGPVKDK